MYLTAMLVRNSVRNWVGVNALLYEDPAQLDPLSQTPSTRRVIAAIEAYVNIPKTLRGSVVRVPPGNNAVDAYLDVVVAGTLQVDHFDLIERRTGEKLTSPDAAETVAWTEQGLLVRAYVRPDEDPVATLHSLVQTSRDLVAHPRRDPPPIRIREIRDSEGFVFELDEVSKERLRALHGATWVAPRIHISNNVLEAFRETHGDIHNHLAAMMTGGIDASYLDRLGGVEIVDAQGVVLWPVRR